MYRRKIRMKEKEMKRGKEVLGNISLRLWFKSIHLCR